MPSEDVVLFDYVVGRYNGERAKSVLAHAHAGSGYYILEEGRQGNQAWCLAVSIWCEPNGPIPEHLTKVVDPFLIKKLDKWRKPNDHDMGPKKAVNPKRMAEIREMFGKGQTKLIEPSKP